MSNRLLRCESAAGEAATRNSPVETYIGGLRGHKHA